MTGSPVLVAGLGAIAADYDALICDVWGVVHDGIKAHPTAVEALLRFRKERGRVVLLTNAPRPPEGIKAMLRQFGVPDDAYDAIVTSGGAARDDLIIRAHGSRLKMLHIGPERDTPVFDGLDVELTGAEEAEVVLCTGLYNDEVETPEDYAGMLATMKARGLTMICANPDLYAPRAGVLVPCAGGIAKLYEAMGGAVAYYGKPKPPIYATALKEIGEGARILVIGDALETDIAGANIMGFDALFVAHGLHKDELGDLTQDGLAALFAHHGAVARAAVDVLKW
ncbi:MAG: TIGR01459 family HAD-type hydrolase [Rhizomicrobium sp.]|nr:TIGR01459 family HAD-type hydrolase [Rhizomicrobium sp.]